MGACIVGSLTDDAHSPSAQTAATNLRILCLGNELLGDDALGYVVAEELRRFASPDVDICCTSESGLELLGRALGVRRLIVVDTVQTGNAPPGTIYRILDSELSLVPGGSPHYVGLCEALSVARKLGLPVAEEVIILAVEALDCLTLGAPMSPQVSSTVPALVNLVLDMMPEVAMDVA